MQKFQLCHPLDAQGREYLVPELLTKEEPPGLDAEFPPQKSLGFVYRYDAVLPEGLLPRFIVSTYVHQRAGVVWRTGVVLERSNCRALVRGDVQARSVTIRVAGNGDRRELLGIIREHFERIHASYQRLPVTEWIAVPGHPETVVRHALLLEYERADRPSIVIQIGDGLVDWPVKQLLDGTEIEGTPRTRERDSASDRLAIRLFISYAREDSAYCAELRSHLKLREHMREIRVWTDELLLAGDRWEEKIASNIDEADIVVVLVSVDYLNSAYAIRHEIKRAEGKVIIPVIVRNSSYQRLLGHLHVILPNGLSVSEHQNRDKAWELVTTELDKVIARLRGELDDAATWSPAE